MKENVFYVKLSLSIPVPIKMYQAPGTEDTGSNSKCVYVWLTCGSNKCVVNMYFSVILPNFLKKLNIFFLFLLSGVKFTFILLCQTTYRTVNEDWNDRTRKHCLQPSGPRHHSSACRIYCIIRRGKTGQIILEHHVWGYCRVPEVCFFLSL